MRAKLVALLAAIAVIALAASGATALPEDELAPENETDEPTAGVCVVGVDSPCNGDAAEEMPGPQPVENDSGDEQVRIPEDQNGDGEIDERFRGDDCTHHDETEHNTDTQAPPPAEYDRDSRLTGMPELLKALLTGFFGLN